MKGLIIYNQDFKDNAKFTEHIVWFQKEASNLGIILEKNTNTEILSSLDLIDERYYDFVLFFDKDIRLAQILENKGLRLFNSSKAIEICDDKTLTQIVLEKSNIETPKTIICPKTFFGFKKEDLSFLDLASSQLSFPLVLKEAFGSFGKEVYLINTQKELEEKVLSLKEKPLLFQEYIKESRGKDIRMHIVGGEFVGAVMRENKEDFRANVTNGGKMFSYKPTQKEIEIGIKACKAIGLDFAGVDILFGKNGPLICEINSNAHMKNFYDITKINIVKEILLYISDSVKNREESQQVVNKLTTHL